MSADAAAAVLEGEIDPIENPQFGASVASGDANGDGLSDLAIGATFATNTRLGRAYVFHGPVAGLVPAATADLAFTGPGLDPFGDFMGTSLLVADLDEDGLGDVTMGAPGFTDGDGFARVFVSPGLR